ncbi:hypothetical protein ALC56_08522 [Trachymyrmex septentrionalis]|uniref:Uncharacterized protein n=1 Tax=Trachymyrmex septentrionalis TaxID=34720 RepID=A0A195F8M6_9HYME|nr:hypothetical protein ALC56_08522 [Trachymyrmex septentrionalis]
MRSCSPGIWPALVRANKYPKARNREAWRDKVRTHVYSVERARTRGAFKHGWNISTAPGVTQVTHHSSCTHAIAAFPSTSVGNLNELPCSRHRFTSQAMNYVRSISKAIC